MDKNTFVFDSVIKNDIIDIYGEPNVKVTKIKTENKNEFKAILEGNSVDFSVANAIRRTVLLYIPVYGFHRDNITVQLDKTDYMYNNDMLYNLIETLPIFDIPNDFDLIDPNRYMPESITKKLFGTFTPNLQENDSTTKDKKPLNIVLSLSVTNTSNTYKFVSTHDATLKINDKVTNSYKNRDPISILVLKPGESVSFNAIANLGIKHAIYEATTIATSIELAYNKYQIQYETLGQLDKNTIFSVACIILSKKLTHLSDFIANKYEGMQEFPETIEIELYGEEHTLGNLIATALQKCEHIARAGYYTPHLFNEHIIIRYVLANKKKNPIKVFIDTLTYLTKLIKKIMTD